jgi:CheY-like chemotaxis protein
MPKPQSVLIIDDDDDDIEMFCEVLTDISDSIACNSATNGHEALELLQNSHPLPDFIFLDLNMPRMNGKQCLVQLKKNEKFSSIPVVIYSTSKSEADREETQQLGSAHFVTKPSSMQKLKKELEFVFEKKGINVLRNNGDPSASANRA